MTHSGPFQPRPFCDSVIPLCPAARGRGEPSCLLPLGRPTGGSGSDLRLYFGPQLSTYDYLCSFLLW